MASLHKVVLIELVVQEYFPVEIEATLCSFSTINYSQSLHHDGQCVTIDYRGSTFWIVSAATHIWKLTLCEFIEATEMSLLPLPGQWQLFLCPRRIAQLPFLFSCEHVELLFGE